ncbi:MAG: UDP-2,3-diacylglucosamine diphosphatase LpxI [Alphaproteobacteria bacterium]|nr:UDP-2,3-diacylglucosamine diphosphatase LpxI [Alphaproteobacteria bacterium]
MAPKLGILAGGGPLPGYLIESCRATGRDVFVIAFEGQADPSVIGNTDHAWVRLGAAGTALDHLRAEGVEEIVMAGPVRRPSLRELRPDRRAAKFLGLGLLNKGDDGLLGSIVNTLEKEEGFRVIGANDVLFDLTAPEGPFGRFQPAEDIESDITRGVSVLQSIGALDIGQAVVVQQGIVLGIEAAEGTHNLLERCGPLRREGRGGVLVKLPKPGQETRVDMPSIGIDTIKAAHAAGLTGIAVGAGVTLVFDREELVNLADAEELFVIGIRATDYVEGYDISL